MNHIKTFDEVNEKKAFDKKTAVKKGVDKKEKREMLKDIRAKLHPVEWKFLSKLLSK